MNQERNNHYVYIGSLPSEIGKQDVLDFFARQGFQIRISKKKSKPTKRYYVVETNDSNAYQAMLRIRMPRIGSSIIQISPFLKGAEKLAYDAQELNKKVYVGNLPIDTDQ